MYQAELRGKLSSKQEMMEDLLTSNVFSFFKYSNRKVFLKPYLQTLDIQVTDRDVENADFQFWPSFESKTEPDLVLLVGNYYLLFEAKYFSDFDGGNEFRDHQLKREIQAGKLEAENLQKEFILIAITADYFYKPNKFSVIDAEVANRCFRWTNWQTVTRVLLNILEDTPPISNQELEFGNDLYSLLIKKNLREFHGLGAITLPSVTDKAPVPERIFFDSKTGKYRGDFLGFETALSNMASICQIAEDYLFMKKGRKYFLSMGDIPKLNTYSTMTFFNKEATA